MLAGPITFAPAGHVYPFGGEASFDAHAELTRLTLYYKVRRLRPEGEPGHWKQKALTLVGVGVFVLFLAALGIYTFVMAVSTKLHPNPKECRR